MGVLERTYRIRDHAILRFWERWRPDLILKEDVVAEMERLAAGSKLVRKAPSWHEAPRVSHRFLRGYLRINQSLVFCLAFYIGEGVQISTVLVRPDKLRGHPVVIPEWVVEMRRERVEQVVRATARRGLPREDERA